MKNAAKILEYLPHRYPFLLIDRIVEYDGESTLVAKKNVTFNEPFFQGHFPGKPVMPGVLIIEALAQAGGMMIVDMKGGAAKEDYIMFFAGIEKARFRKPVVPGDTLLLKIKLLSFRRGLAKIEGTATVNGEKAAEAILLSTLKRKEDMGIK